MNSGKTKFAQTMEFVLRTRFARIVNQRAKLTIYEPWLGPLKDALGDALDEWR